MADQLRAVTLHQPWATCISHGGKRVENRGWRPHVEPGTRIAIHAGATCDNAAWDHVRQTLWPDILTQLPQRAVVAVATYRGVVVARERPGDTWAAGPLCWVLDEVRAIEPVPCAGQRGLWLLSEHLTQLVAAARTLHTGRCRHCGQLKDEHGDCPEWCRGI